MTSAPSPTVCVHGSSPSLAELANLCRSSAPPLDSSGVWSQSAVYEWAAALDSVLAVHGSQAEWSGLLSAEDKHAILEHAVIALPLQSKEQEGGREGDQSISNHTALSAAEHHSQAERTVAAIHLSSPSSAPCCLSLPQCAVSGCVY